MKSMVLAAALLSVASVVGAAEQTVFVSLEKERVGAEPVRFIPIVGNWVIAEDHGAKVVQVDGREWIKGQPSAGLTDKARKIYGPKREEFIDSVKAYAYYPYAISRDIEEFHEGEIIVRFRLVSGQLDQCAGILFNLKSNGDYVIVRFNGKEDNLVLWTFKNGKRDLVRKGTEETHLIPGEWHRMKVVIAGAQMRAFLDDRELLHHTFTEPVTGRIGIWSKTDSVSQFDGYEVRSTP